MKKVKLSIVSILGVIGLISITSFSGCTTSQTTAAYKTESATDAVVTAAWSTWLAYLKANSNISLATQQQVSAAFNKVKAAELVALDTTSLAATNGNTNGVAVSIAEETQALTDLDNLLATFNIKL